MIEKAYTGKYLKCDIHLFLKTNPSVIIVVPAGHVFYVTTEEEPAPVRGINDHKDLLSGYITAKDKDGTWITVSVWVSKMILEEAEAYQPPSAL